MNNKIKKIPTPQNKMTKILNIQSNNMKQDLDTKVSRKTIQEMELVNFTTKMEVIMMENGKTIRCMDGGCYTMRMGILRMRDIG